MHAAMVVSHIHCYVMKVGLHLQMTINGRDSEKKLKIGIELFMNTMQM
jgi:hypothetical protein